MIHDVLIFVTGFVTLKFVHCLRKRNKFKLN